MEKKNVVWLGATFVLGMLILGGSLVLMVNNLKSYDRDSNTPYIKNVRVVTNVVYYLKD